MAERTLAYVGREIGRILRNVKPDERYDVSLRVYHGWHRGFEPTDNRRAIATAAAATDFATLSNKPNIAIRPELAYGDRLLSALDPRLHARRGIHLPNTQRRGRHDELEEKMVDTAIASDVVDFAHREPDDWIIVMGDDDDLVPAVYTAEAVQSGRAGRVILARERSGGPFLKLDGILVRP